MASSSDYPTGGGDSMLHLYMELDEMKWYYKFAASLANWIMLAGFVIFPASFANDGSKYRLEPTSLRIIALTLLFVGYISTGLLCWKFRNPLFHFDALFVPGFSNSTIGFLSAMFNVGGKIYSPNVKHWSISAIVAVVISCIFMLFYGVAAINANHKLEQKRQTDEYNRRLIMSQEDESCLTEEERTRRNLLKLLLAPEQQQKYTNRVEFSPNLQYTPKVRQSRFARFYHALSSPNPPPTSSSKYGTSYPMNYYSSYTQIGQDLGAHDQVANPWNTYASQPNLHEQYWRPETGYTGAAASHTGYVSPSMQTYPASTSNDVYVGSTTEQSSVGPSSQSTRSLERQNSLFVNLSATVGRGPERVGAKWTSWSTQ